MNSKYSVVLLLCVVGCAVGMEKSQLDTEIPSYEGRDIFELLMGSAVGRMYLGRYRGLERRVDLAHGKRDRILVTSSWAYGLDTKEKYESIEGTPLLEYPCNIAQALIGALGDTEMVLASDDLPLTLAQRDYLGRTRDNDLRLLRLMLRHDSSQEGRQEIIRLTSLLLRSAEKFRAKCPRAQPAHDAIHEEIRTIRNKWLPRAAL